MTDQMKRCKHLTEEDREEIQAGLNVGMTFKQIARRIQKDQTTVPKEVKKHIEKSLKSPLVILTALAIILNLTGAAKWFLSTPAGDVYTNIVSTVTAPITVLVLLSVGYNMSFGGRR